MSDDVGKATATAMAMARRHPVLDVQLWLTELGNAPVTLVLTAEQIATDAQAQLDQARVLIEFLAASGNATP